MKKPESVKMIAHGTFRCEGVGEVQAGAEFECDPQRADYLSGIGMASKMDSAPKNKMAAAPKNKGMRNAD
jgi:hypothetical protein